MPRDPWSAGPDEGIDLHQVLAHAEELRERDHLQVMCLPADDPIVYLDSLVLSLWVHSGQTGDRLDLDRAISLGGAALALTLPLDASLYLESLLHRALGEELWEMYQSVTWPAPAAAAAVNLDRAVETAEMSLGMTSAGPDWLHRLDHLAGCLADRYLASGRVSDLERAVELWRVVAGNRTRDGVPPGLELRPSDRAWLGRGFDPQRIPALSLSGTRAMRLLDRDSATDATQRASRMEMQANMLDSRYRISGERDDLERSINLWEETLVIPARSAVAERIVPSGRQDRLQRLADRLAERYWLDGDPADLERSVDLWREAIEMGILRGGLAVLGASADMASFCLAVSRLDECAWAADRAIEAAEWVLGSVEQTAERRLPLTQGVVGRGAFARARSGDVPGAVEMLERGLAVLATERLLTSRVSRHEARFAHPDLLAAFEDELGVVSALVSGAGRTFEASERDPVLDLSLALVALEVARERLESALGRPLLPGISFADVVATASGAGEKVVYLLCTEVGGAALIVEPDGSATALQLQGLSYPAVEGWCTQITSLEGPREVTVRGVARTSLAPVSEAEATVEMERLLAGLEEALRPLAGVVSGGVRLIPTGNLARLPLAGVMARSWGVAACTAVSARTCRVALDQAKRPHPASYAALAAPDPCHLHSQKATVPLPGAAEEALWLEKSHGARTRVGPEATRDHLVEMLTFPWAVVHIATHGEADPAHAESGAILLADGPDGSAGRLRVADLGELTLNVRLVCLAVGPLGAPGRLLPDEAIGFPTLLVEAGAAGVVAPLWPVPDQATTDFMRAFYDHLADGHPPARALALTQAGAADGEALTWAAFYLTGA